MTSMPRLQPALAQFTQATFSSSTDAINAATISDAVAPILFGPTFPPTMRVHIALPGATTTTEVQVSVGAKDATNIETWSAPQITEIRTLPDSTKVASMLVFRTGRAVSLRIAVETAIQGAGAKIYYAFEDESV